MPLCSGIAKELKNIRRGRQIPAAVVLQWLTGVTGITYTNSNLTATATQTSEKTVLSSYTKSSGKWYAEVIPTNTTIADQFVGVATNNSNFPGASGSGGFGVRASGAYFNNAGGNTFGTSATYNSGDICQLAIDFDSKKFWFGKNGTWANSGNPAAGTNPIFSDWTGSPVWYLAVRVYYINNVAVINTPLTYSIPSGFSAW
jgi:hypothetical protein